MHQQQQTTVVWCVHASHVGQVEGLEGGLERGKTGGGKERGNGGKTRGGGEMELKESQVETPTEELTSLNDKVCLHGIFQLV